MKGPASFSSMLANGCRSFSAPAVLVRTLALTHVALSKHSNSYRHVKMAWFSRSSNKRKFARQSLKQDVSQPTAVSSANGQWTTKNRALGCLRRGACTRIYLLSSGPSSSISSILELYIMPLCVHGLLQLQPQRLKHRASIKGKTVREAQKTFRITHPDQFVETGTYLRVHVRPKRFPRCYEIDWKSRIVAVTDEFVVLDKPAGTTEELPTTSKKVVQPLPLLSWD